MAFSANNRKEIIQQCKSTQFDLLVIGGGITGAGIALDAITRGLKVALVEKNDFGSGTSSRSTKLIHGGLRYLKQLEIGIVREVGKERAILFKNAPHIVIPEKMLLPIVKGGTLGKYSTSLALKVYDYLAGVVKKERRYMINKKQTLAQEPLLREDVLKGGGVYIEYRSDDARLVIEVIKTAVEKGAVCLNYANLTDFLTEEGKVSGGVIQDELGGNKFSINAAKVINAGGPWVDDVRKLDGEVKGKRLHLTKGIHLVVKREKLPIRSSVYFDVPTDKRMIFAIPRFDKVYLGTTDTNYTADTNTPFCEPDDADYVLKAVNYMFPNTQLTYKDIESTWAGLRPLIHEDGKSPSELSRKDEIFISESGLISIAGGKLTGFRKMAERSVDEAMEQLHNEQKNKFVACTTDQIQLSGGYLNGSANSKEYVEDLTSRFTSIDPDIVENLYYKYGSNTDKILEKSKSIDDEENAVLFAEIEYGIEEEMVATVSDFIIRRTGRLYFERPYLEKKYLLIHNYIVGRLGYDSLTAEKQLKAFEEEYNRVIAFKN